MELILMDEALEIIGQPLELFSSLQWNRSYYDVGTFELHTAADVFPTLRAARFLYRRDTGEGGIIERVAYTQAEDGSLACAASGRFLEALMERNIIDRTFRTGGSAEDVLRQLTDTFAIHPAEPARAIAQLELGVLSGLGSTISLQTTWSNLLEKLQEIGKAQELALRVRLDFARNALLFEVWQGKDRTQGQTANSWATFSNNFENLRTLTYTRDAKQYRNFAYVAGEGEGTQRFVTTIDQTGGGERREIYIDAKDLRREKEDGTQISEDDYRALLLQRGYERLAQYGIVETMEGTINTDANLIYRRDFDLGDKCTCVGPGVVKEARITQITEVYEPNGLRVTASFGDGYITDISKFLKREVG